MEVWIGQLHKDDIAPDLLRGLKVDSSVTFLFVLILDGRIKGVFLTAVEAKRALTEHLELRELVDRIENPSDVQKNLIQKL